MKNMIIKWILKAGSFIAAFCTVFYLLQSLLIPKYRSDGTIFVSEYFELDKDSIDVLFLGSSQITCGIDTPRLSSYYGIPAYNFCASGSSFEIEEYYLKKALETQSPKLVMADVGNIFISDEELTSDLQMSYFYSPMPLDKYKIESLYEVSGGDIGTVFSYSFPLFLYSSRWKELTIDDIIFYLKYKYYNVGGFLRRDYKMPVTLAYYSVDDGEEKEITDRKKRAIDSISTLCEDNGIQLIFIKVVSPTWTRTESRILTEYMAEHSLECIDMNEYIEEIGIDPEQDFRDMLHLNIYGAEKTTDFLAEIIQEKLDLPKEML